MKMGEDDPKRRRGKGGLLTFFEEVFLLLEGQNHLSNWLLRLFSFLYRSLFDLHYLVVGPSNFLNNKKGCWY